MNENVDLELLEQYLDGLIDKNEVLSVEGRPIDYKVLDKQIEEFLKMRDHLSAEGLRVELQEFVSKRKEIRTFPLYRIMTIAASIVLVGVVIFILLDNRPSEPKFDDYFDHFDQLLSFRNGDVLDYSDGLEAYASEDYERAFRLLSPKVNDLNNEVRFYLGLSAVGSGRFNESLEILEQVDTEPPFKFYQQTRWYLALAYWQIDNSKLAIYFLNQIQEGDFKFNEAQLLIKQLKN